MFQTNPPEFDSVPDNPDLSSEVDGKAEGPQANEEKGSRPATRFATLEAFSSWIDIQLADLEANNEGFETASSVRGFYGR